MDRGTFSLRACTGVPYRLVTHTGPSTANISVPADSFCQSPGTHNNEDEGKPQFPTTQVLAARVYRQTQAQQLTLQPGTGPRDPRD